MQEQQSLFGKYLHLYNKGNHKDALFKNEDNYYQFLDLYKKYLKPVALLYAYCLLPTHFHFLIKVKDIKDIGDICQSDEMFWYQYNSFLGIYTKINNKVNNRSGCLFNGGYSHQVKSDEKSFCKLIVYIHQNPELYGIVSDYRLWPFSSYFAYERKDRRAIIAKDLFFNDVYYREIMEPENCSYNSNPDGL